MEKRQISIIKSEKWVETMRSMASGDYFQTTVDKDIYLRQLAISLKQEGFTIKVTRLKGIVTVFCEESPLYSE